MLCAKKGDATSMILFSILIFFFAVSLMIGAFFTSELKEAITNTRLNDSSIAPTIINHMETITTSTIQKGFVVIFAFLVIGMMVSSFLVRIHPIFLFIYIILLAGSIFVSMFLANTYQELCEVSALNNIAIQQTMITGIMSHSALIMLCVGALSLIIIFSKVFRQGGFTEIR